MFNQDNTIFDKAINLKKSIFLSLKNNNII